jgi:hypothetical protein
MVLDLILRVCPGSPFRRRGGFGGWTPPSLRCRDPKRPLRRGATAGHGFLDSGIVLCVFAWKPLAGLRSVALLSAMSTNATVFL